MRYEEAAKEAHNRWGGEGKLHLFNVIKIGKPYGKGFKTYPYYMVGPNVDTLICEQDKNPQIFGEGSTWEQAFEDFNNKFQPQSPKVSSETIL